MTKKLLNAAAFILVVVVNYLANALPINGKTTGMLSDQYANLFVPAGITFAIWGLIYLLLLAFVVAQFFRKDNAAQLAIGWLFALSCLLNVSWIFLWHYEQLVLSLIVMGWLLRTLFAINQELRHVNDNLARVTFGIYLGWICIATIANVTTVLVSISWNGFGLSEVVWTIVLIAIGAALTIYLIGRLRNPYLAMAVVWAFYGIVLKRHDDYPMITYSAAIAMGLVGGTAISWVMRQRKAMAA